ncbi:MAG: type I 3-dehydroquinate dehydratase, partial [Treponema sp.]
LGVLKEYSDLIINATSIGMLEGEEVLPFYEFSGSESVFDLIYKPEKTKLLQSAEEKGCRICNGYSMLKYQAEEQFKIFMGDKNDKY